ncbi:prolactin-7A1-like [Psammomys obesus]|uniref:prolactin-7A1-like n=1 Tax=Psammomys obesus TaxID=48139 RepID=UPI002452F5F1|nr:prolactin-7A1-like [Psammomys obesus]
MPLSFSQPCSWALLLLVVSNFLLWENVASVALGSSNTEDDQQSLKDQFHNTLALSQTINDQNMKLRKIFTISELSAKIFDNFLNSSLVSLDQFMFMFLGEQKLLVKNLTSCHNYSIKTPENMDDAQSTSLEEFPILILSRVLAWKDTLKNLLTVLGSIPGTDDDVISLVKDIERKNAKLLKDTKSILSSVYGTTENVDYPLWSGFEDFQSSDELSQFIALCKLSYCLHVDIQTVDLYLKLLSCLVVGDSDICSSLSSTKAP